MKLRKRVLASALTVALVIANAMPVYAVSGSGDAPTESCVTTVVTAVQHFTGTAPASNSTIAETIPTTSSVAGVASTTAGVYLAKKVAGTAITSSVDSIAAGYGLTAGEKPYVRFSDMDSKKSYLAAAALNNAAASIGAEVGPIVNLEIGKMSAGKFSLLSQDGSAITVKLGIPGNFKNANKTYAIIAVRPGGAISVIADADTNPNTVTFTTTGGQGAYAIVRY